MKASKLSGCTIVRYDYQLSFYAISDKKNQANSQPPSWAKLSLQWPISGPTKFLSANQPLTNYYVSQLIIKICKIGKNFCFEHENGLKPHYCPVGPNWAHFRANKKTKKPLPT